MNDHRIKEGFFSNHSDLWITKRYAPNNPPVDCFIKRCG
jgi:hypothetical protein